MDCLSGGREPPFVEPAPYDGPATLENWHRVQNKHELLSRGRFPVTRETRSDARPGLKSGRCESGRAHPRTGVRGVGQDGEVPIRVRARHPNEKPNFARKLQVQEGRSVASSANKEARHYRVRFIPKNDFLRFYAGFCQFEGTSFVGA